MITLNYKDTSEYPTKKFMEALELDDYEIETEDGWVDIKAVGKTIKYTVWELQLDNGYNYINLCKRKGTTASERIKSFVHFELKKEEERLRTINQVSLNNFVETTSTEQELTNDSEKSNDHFEKPKDLNTGGEIH
jgi:hypothetical protein